MKCQVDSAGVPLPRILFVSRSLPFHNIGGMEAVAWDLARELASSGASVSILTTSCKSLPSDSVVEGVRIFCVASPPGRYSSAFWLKGLLAYKRLFEKETDVVLSVGGGARLIGLLRQGSRPVMVAQSHGTAWGEFLSKLRQGSPLGWLKAGRNVFGMVEDLAYRRFDAAIAVGDVVASDLKKLPTRAIIGSLSLYVIPNGINPTQFSFNQAARCEVRERLGLDDDARLVLSASRLHRQKGVVEGLEGFLLAASKDTRLHLAIVGDGPEAGRVSRRVKESDFAERVHVVGGVPRAELRSWLSAADVFLFPTLRVEVGVTLSLLEASAAGLPVVASSSVMHPALRGAAVNPRHAESVASAIVQCLPSEVGGRERPSLLTEDLTLFRSASRYLDLFTALQEREL